MELHGAGYRHGMGHGQELPFRCDLIVSSAMSIGGDCVADDSNASWLSLLIWTTLFYSSPQAV